MNHSATSTLPLARDTLAESACAPSECEPIGQSDFESTDAVAEGAAAWLKRILERFEGPLLRYAKRITGDFDAARDAVQETFLRACRENREALDGHLAQWLFRVCRSRAVDAQRKEQRMSIATDLDLQSLTSPETPPDLLAAGETSSRLLDSLSGLPANQQEVIRLKFQNDFSYREIADITGLSVSNVGFLLHAGLKRLRELMKDD
jgi:RNA polymerase sigma factor (sigma-70 family)